MSEFANDTVLIITGIPCVGKTSVAYRIINNYSVFRRVSETDIIRTIVRSTLNNLIDCSLLKEGDFKKIHPALFESLTISNLDVTKRQAKELIPYIKEIILRQQRRRIPTIIEGSGIVPSLYFPNGCPEEWINDRVIFVNLYVSDIAEQRKRRQNRFFERKYTLNYNEIEEKEEKVLVEKNISLHTEALQLHANNPNVFSIDTANKTIEKIADEIISIILSYFSTLTR